MSSAEAKNAEDENALHHLYSPDDPCGCAAMVGDAPEAVPVITLHPLAQEAEAGMIADRNHFHRNPELSFKVR